MLNLYVEGLAEPIGTTGNHPFWSEDEQRFKRADELRPGERLQSLAGSPRVLRVERRSTPQPVYNLEVQVDHVYHVGSCGLLVHNGNSNLDDCFRGRFVNGTVDNPVQLVVPARRTDLHHTIPREIRKSRRTGESLLPEHLVEHPDIRGRSGNPNRWPVDHDLHVDIHKRNRLGKDFNTRWKEELKSLEKVKPKNDWTVEDILDIRDRLVIEFEIDGYRP